MSPSEALRIAIVGPTHPYKGGVTAHTTELAHALEAAGHDVQLVSWSNMFPKNFYPSEEGVPGGTPDVPLFPRTIRSMSWRRPDTWVRTGRRLQDVDAIIVVHVMPIMIPGSLTLLQAAGVGRTSSTGLGPRSIVIAHNVLPHEVHPGAEAMTRSFLRRVDAVVVHSDEEARRAHEHDARRVVVADLPPHLPGGPPAERPEHHGPARLLALGTVRHYKGIDLLLRAMMRVPGVTLTIAGEMWSDTGPLIRRLAADRRLRGRVEVHGGYVPAERLPELLARHDVLALAYRSATASQNVLLAQQHGLAVLASDVGTFGDQVRDGVDGLLVPAEDEDALVAALTTLADPDRVTELLAGVRPPDLSTPWQRYVAAIESVAGSEPQAVVGGDGDEPVVESALRAIATRLRTSTRAAIAQRPPRVLLTGDELPDRVRPTDVLGLDADAEDARALARSVGLPRTLDPIAAWAALGALAAVLRLRDDHRQTATVIDESGVRSPFGRWARAIGFHPIELELSGGRSSVSVLDLGTASVDVITRLHPHDCDLAEVDDALHQASWALRTGGVLSLTLAAGPAGAPGCVTPADLRGVVARADGLGLRLVGDLDGDLTAKLRRAADAAHDETAAFAVVRLTFRRR